MKLYRLLSAFLAFIMVFALCPAIALDTFAAEGIDVNGKTDDTTIFFQYEPDGSNTNSTGAYTMPLNFWNGKSGDHAQMIIPSTYFDGDDNSKTFAKQEGKSLKKLQFILSGKYNQSSANSNMSTITVKIGSTDKTQYGSSQTTNQYISTTWTQVFKDKPTITSYDSSYDVMVIEFDTPFEYSGGNIVIDFYTDTFKSISNYKTSGSIGFNYRQYTAKNYVGHGCDNYTKNWLPKTIFTFAGSERVTVTPGNTNFTANGEEQYPTVTVKDTQTGATLGTDYYDLSFSGAGTTPVAAGSYIMTLTFKNGYSGTKTVNFTINPALDPSSETTVFFKDGSGQAGTAEEGAYQMPINLWNGGLHSQMIFSSAYFNASNSSQTFAAQSGKSITKLEFILNGKYSESARKSLKDVTVKVGTTTQVRYTTGWTAKVDHLSITEGLQTVFEGEPTITDYDSTHDKLVIEFTNPFKYNGGNIVLDFRSSGTINISPTTGSKGYYYVQFSDSSMHVGIGADTNSKDWLPFTIFTFKDEKATVVYDPAEELVADRNGKVAKQPNVTVKDTQTKADLVLGTDYTVSFNTTNGTAPTTAGTYTMTITFIGNYSDVTAKEIGFVVQKPVDPNVFTDTVYVATDAGKTGAQKSSWTSMAVDLWGESTTWDTKVSGTHSQMMYPADFFDNSDNSKTLGSKSGNSITKLEFVLSGSNFNVGPVTGYNITVSLGTSGRKIETYDDAVIRHQLTPVWQKAETSHNAPNLHKNAPDYYITELTEVFDGTPYIAYNSTIGKYVLVVEFDTPFMYDEADKAIVVDVVRTSSGTALSGTVGYEVYELGGDDKNRRLTLGNDHAGKSAIPLTVFTFQCDTILLDYDKNQQLTVDTSNSPKSPKFKLIDQVKNYTLVENTDYTVSYNTTNGTAPTAAGSYVMTITFKGTYAELDAKTIAFEVKEGFKVNVSVENKIYNGTALFPIVTVTDTSGKVLILDKDYSLTLNGGNSCINVGTYDVVVTEIRTDGMAATSQVGTFTILPQPYGAKVPAEEKFTVNDAEVVVSNGGSSLSYGTDTDNNLPIAINSKWNSHTQTIIPGCNWSGNGYKMSADMKNKTFNSLTLYYKAATGCYLTGGTVTVKLKEVDYYTFSGEYEENMTDATTVFSGEIEIVGNTIVLNFSTPYTYKGGNLLVDFEGYLAASGNKDNPISFLGVVYSQSNGSWTLPQQNRTYGCRYFSDDGPFASNSSFSPQMSFGYTVERDSAVTVTYTAESKKWNNAPQGTTVTVKDTVFGEEKVLVEDVDYVILYNGSATKPTLAGNYEVTVKFMGNYSGTTASVGTFKITQGDIDANKLSLNIEGWHVGKTANQPLLSGAPDGAKVTFTYAVKGTENYSATVPTAAGDYMVKATIEATTSYKGTSVGKAFTIQDHQWTAASCTLPKTCSVCNVTDGNALGHSWVDATCTVPKTCSVCKTTDGSSLGHAEVAYEAKAPTCTEIGWDAYVTCSRCDYTTYVEKAMLGHDEKAHDAKAPTCTEIGWDAYVTCSRCSYTTYVEKAKLGHAEVAHDAKAPTCTEVGWDAHVTCSRCSYTTYVEKAALNHDWKDATCTTPKTCQREGCGVIEGEALGHKYESVTTDPTCTESGRTTYTCTVCEYSYQKEFAPAWGHLESPKEIENEVKATCVTAGTYDEVIKCIDCNAELDRKTVTVDALGHTYADAVVNFSEDGKKYTVTVTCTVCAEDVEGHTATGEFNSEVLSTTAGDCKTQGTTTYKAEGTFKENIAYYATKIVSGAMGECNYGAVTYEGDGKAEYKATRTCTVCDTPQVATATIKSEETNKATCTIDGKATYTVTFAESWATGKTFTEVIKAPGHNYTTDKTDSNYLKSAATCTAKAVYYKSCSACGTKHETDTFEHGELKPHTEATDAAVAATCLVTGLTEGKHCSVCNTVIVAQEVVPATGHTEEILPAVAPTCTVDGKKEGKKCSVCNTVTLAQEVDPALGHTPGEAVKENEVKATCTAAGSYDMVVYCTVETCKAEVSRQKNTVNALGHKDENADGKCDECATLMSAALTIPENQQAVYTVTINCVSGTNSGLKLGSNEIFSLYNNVIKLFGVQTLGTYPAGNYTVKVTINPTQKMVSVDVIMPNGHSIRRADYKAINGNSYTLETFGATAENVSGVNVTYSNVHWEAYTIIDTEPQNGSIYNVVTSFTDARTDRAFAWTADWNGTAVLRYRVKAEEGKELNEWILADDNNVELVGNYGTEYFYKADISGLIPGTTYEYQIGSGRGNDNSSWVWTPEYTFTTAAANSAGAFTFVAIGDTQSHKWDDAKLAQAAINEAMLKNPNAAFILHTGDVVENNPSWDPEEWNLYFKALGYTGTKIPHFVASGNHDVWLSTNKTPYLFNQHFNHPDNGVDLKDVYISGNNPLQNMTDNSKETVYSFDYGNAHIIVLNSGAMDGKNDPKILEAQRQWLINDLNANKHAEWTIIMVHQPVYHRLANSGYDTPALQNIIEDPQYGVDLVIQGHSHLVSRTYPMSKGSIVDAATAYNNSNPDSIKRGSGVVYITIGSTTTAHDDFTYENYTTNTKEMMLIAIPENNQASYATFDVTDGALTVTIRQLDGLVLDQFAIEGAYKGEKHTEQTVYAKNPTCTEAGWNDYSTCSCGDYIITKVEIPATGHTLTHHAAVAVTCTTPGAVEYWSCSVCNTNFADGGQYTTNELKTAIEISALGHKDENKDHVCDNGCGEPQGTHADSPDDKDHVCDYGCNAVLEPCADPDNDHKCDVCQAVLTTCKDENNDFLCDICKNKIVNAYADAIGIDDRFNGTITVNDRMVRIVYTDDIPFAKSAGGEWGHWVGFKLTIPVAKENVRVQAPNGKDPYEITDEILDGPDFVYFYWNMTNVQSTYYYVDWNGDGTNDLTVYLDVSLSKLLECVHSDVAGDSNHTCDNCGKQNVSDHTWTDATCTAPKTCSECKATEGDKLPHSFGEYSLVANNTNLTVAACSACPAKDYKPVVSEGGDDKTVTVTPEVNENTSTSTLGKDLLKAIAEDAKELVLSVQSSVAELVFDNAAIKAALGQIAETVQNVTIYAEKTAETEKSHKYEIHLKVDGVAQESTSFGDGEVTVTIPLAGFGDLTGKNVKVWYVENGTRKNEMASTHDRENGMVTFKTNHFSEYEVEVVSETPTGVTVNFVNYTVQGTVSATISVAGNAVSTTTHGVGVSAVLGADRAFTVVSTQSIVVAYTTDGTTYTSIAVSDVANTYVLPANVSGDIQIAIVFVGDVNLNGKINATDAKWALQSGTGNKTLSSLAFLVADVNGNSKVNATDAKKILQYGTGSITSWK